MSEWEEWVRRVTGGASSREVGERIGRSHTTALQWMRDGATPAQVVRLAKAYDADVLGALVAAGFLEERDVEGVNVEGLLKRLPGVRLTAELHRREVLRARLRRAVEDYEDEVWVG